jgi:hypothetical protein
MTCGRLYKLSNDCGDGEDTRVVNVVMTLIAAITYNLIVVVEIMMVARIVMMMSS